MQFRVGRDDSVKPIRIFRGFGIGIYSWLWYVLFYIMLMIGGHELIGDTAWGTALMDFLHWFLVALLGAYDLLQRLRTREYAWVNDTGQEMILKASLLDRLTFKECGRYFVLIILPIPLWLVCLPLAWSFYLK
ncbi:MAG: hypothetical protein HQM12_18540 [SAR324 cluster bacterium]|nr:hypothetical protein [SAR324 cluster bacterium]